MNTFEQIVFDSYENGDFDLSSIEHIGNIHPEDLTHSGVTIVHRTFGNAIIRECLSSGLELTTVESPGLGNVRHTLLEDGTGHVIDEDSPHFIRTWGSDGVVHESTVIDESPQLDALPKDDLNKE